MHPYFHLMRLHQPTGIWLLLWPCWWALALASHGLPPLNLLVLFGVGAVVMRGAGCIINDIIDRDVDKYIERTRLRPLASGELSVMQACLLLFVLLCIALVIVLQLNSTVFFLAAGSLVLVVAYPFMKRITWWPQAFLGLTFNWGALLGWAAVRGEVDAPAIALYVGGIFWTLGYDTIYAHQDKDDDIKIGVKSTALRLGEKSKSWIAGFYTIALVAWMAAGYLNHNTATFFISCIAVAIHFAWQIVSVRFDDSANCMKIFRSNTILGWILFLAVLADSAV